jgi:hypothetical protein
VGQSQFCSVLSQFPHEQSNSAAMLAIWALFLPKFTGFCSFNVIPDTMMVITRANTATAPVIHIQFCFIFDFSSLLDLRVALLPHAEQKRSAALNDIPQLEQNLFFFCFAIIIFLHF